MENEVSELMSRKRIMNGIEVILLNVLLHASCGKPPKLIFINRRTWDNVHYDEEKNLQMHTETKNVTSGYATKKTRQSFTLMMDILARVYKLLATEGFSTKREIYYEDPKLYCSQKTVDRVIDDVTCLLKVPRRALHIYASSKGCVGGNLKFSDSTGHHFNCVNSNSGILIPSDVKKITNMRTEAEVVFVVEDDATFRKLLEEPLEELPPAIFLTGKGYPDLSTREMVKLIWETFHLPIYVLVDADPHGLEIMFVYRFGSLASMHDNDNLAVPAARWLGILPSDVERLCIPADVLLPMSDGDRKKLVDLLRRPYCRDPVSAVSRALVNQIAILQRLDVKAEIQSLHRLSAHFLSTSYLPSKLRRGSWI